MTDVFITTHKNRSKDREYFFYLTEIALHLQGFNVKIVEEPMLTRYFMCEQRAKSDIYILCDDDIIPATSDALDNLVGLMKNNKGYSQIGLSWRRDMENEKDNSWFKDTSSTELWESDHCGGCMAIRKGTIKDLGYECDYAKGLGDDQVMGRTAREMGYKVGIAPKLYFHHLGAGKSVVWK